MARILGLDLSTKPGLVVADHDGSGKLPDIVERESYKINSSPAFPYGAIENAHAVADIVEEWVVKHRPDEIVIEQTNKGKNRYSQKQLEFVHYAVLTRLKPFGITIKYIDTSEWRRVLGQHMSKDDKKNNAKVSKAKKTENFHAAKKAAGVRGKITPKHLALRWVKDNYGIDLLMKENDIADAICIVAAAVRPETSFCDGT